MTPKTAYIVFTQETPESMDYHFVSLDRITAERASKEINDYRMAVKAMYEDEPEGRDPDEWDAWNDRRIELEGETGPCGVRITSFHGHSSVREIPLI